MFERNPSRVGLGTSRLRLPLWPWCSRSSRYWFRESIDYLILATLLPKSYCFSYLTSLLILPQVSPNLKVLIVSCVISELSATHTINYVMQLPESESFINIVKALSRQEMKPLLDLESISMTRPRALKEVLMFLASASFTKETPVLLMRSDPARSTKVNLDETTELPFLRVSLMVTKQCDLLERSLRAWLLAVLVASMIFIMLRSSSLLFNSISFWPLAENSGLVVVN